jgi:hypothetical protein
MTMIACFLYFLINCGFSIPNFERKKEAIGNSNTKPEAITRERTNERYSFAAILSCIIESLPKLAKNPNAGGIKK